MKKEKLAEIYRKYNLEKEDIFKHQHYLIITRSGIEKIMGVEEILTLIMKLSSVNVISW